jgi:hypothetical protein
MPAWAAGVGKDTLALAVIKTNPCTRDLLNSLAGRVFEKPSKFGPLRAIRAVLTTICLSAISGHTNLTGGSDVRSDWKCLGKCTLVIYAYYRGDEVAYVGRARGFGTPQRVLETRHQGHLSPYSTVPFDQILRQNPDHFKPRILCAILGINRHHVRRQYHRWEAVLIDALAPTFNVIRPVIEAFED